MACPGPFRKSRPVNPLDQSRFQYIRNKEIVRHWHARGRSGAVNPAADCFEPFIFTWIALNAWGECVTDQEQDERWVQDLAQDPSLSQEFTIFLSGADSSRCLAEEFRKFWPIPSVQSWRRATDLSPATPDARIRAQFFAAQRIRCSPECSFYHFEESGEIPLDWLHFLPAVYRVRCNLFHGEKSPLDRNDGAIVRAAFVPLSQFMDHLGYFG